MKQNTTIHFDNIATPGAPVWRERRPKPLTCYAVRMELVRQAAQLPDYEQARYLNDRLTALDKALTDSEASAVEGWLNCEELLQGRAQIVDYEGGCASSFGPRAPIPSEAMEMLRDHAERKRAMLLVHRCALASLAALMEMREWRMDRALIADIKAAASALEKMDRVAHCA
ncbi:MAG TPA: hypothetical protein VFO41_04050 [Alphaproteobacteria bacterium]|nr:hypothetical protein [Alphaproteobacteria bacterium]